MSEYIEIETEIDDNDLTIKITTNLVLTESGSETYHSLADMEEGSPVAQALSMIDGITQLTIHGKTMTITRTPDAPWHNLVGDISAALKDFFL
jgi:hypothetical protein